ncbi:hypothetical protein SOV_33670 [Sporomusa ovata DSM 2662]|nr:hypothetical protein SOV_5c04700 [Sporomusa ovata DSM 2662]
MIIVQHAPAKNDIVKINEGVAHRVSNSRKCVDSDLKCRPHLLVIRDGPVDGVRLDLFMIMHELFDRFQDKIHF